MISVSIILSGILWILFSSVDRNYKYPTISPALQREQSEIIKKIYHVQTKAPEVQQETVRIQPKILSKQYTNTETVTVTVKPILEQQDQRQQVNSNTVQKDQYNDVWSTFPSSDYESYYYLRNNPWSPDYKPGY